MYTKMSVPVSIKLDPTSAGIMVLVTKVKTDVSELKKELALETAARNELQKNVVQLEKDSAEVKQFITESAKDVGDRNIAKKTMRMLMKTLPCKSLEELDWLLAYIANRSLYWAEHIKLMGGNDFNTAIKTTINTTMNRSVQKQLSWSGIRSKKPSLKFKYKRIVDGIHVAMMDRFKDYTIVRGEAKLQKLLQNAASSK